VSIADGCKVTLRGDRMYEFLESVLITNLQCPVSALIRGPYPAKSSIGRGTIAAWHEGT